MAQRESGYALQDHSHYPTPPWVIGALADHVTLNHKSIWEPACGTGFMVEALKNRGALVTATDIHDHGYPGMYREADFLEDGNPSGMVHYEGIVTNPPYGPQGRTAEAFIHYGLRKITDYGFLALLLPVDFDSAKTRGKFFRECPQFAAKIVLTRRIKWFEAPEGEKKAGPSANHAWFLWQRTWLGDLQIPRILYAPIEVRL